LNDLLNELSTSLRAKNSDSASQKFGFAAGILSKIRRVSHDRVGDEWQGFKRELDRWPPMISDLDRLDIVSKIDVHSSCRVLKQALSIQPRRSESGSPSNKFGASSRNSEAGSNVIDASESQPEKQRSPMTVTEAGR
jgi:hypothetical protein